LIKAATQAPPLPTVLASGVRPCRADPARPGGPFGPNRRYQWHGITISLRGGLPVMEAEQDFDELDNGCRHGQGTCDHGQ
jgi:hypothetical protein